VPFDNLTPDGAAVRSLSEQLRDLEAQLGHDNALSLPPVARCTKLPTHLGRPIGLTRLESFPRIRPLNADPDAEALQPEPPPSSRAKVRRGATIIGIGLLLLASTAIVPPLLFHRPLPAATQPPIPAQLVTVQRTERFAQSARELRDAAPGAIPPPEQARAILARQLVAPQPTSTRTTSRFEPTAAEGQAAPDPMIILPPRVR
jgi:hypothetical protein